MERLRDSELRALGRFAEDSYRLSGVPAYRRHIVEALPRFVPCTLVAYNEINFHKETIWWEAEPAELPRFPGAEAILSQHLHEHPVLAHFERARLHAWFKISDFVTRRQFRRTALYNEFYRRIETEDQIGLVFPKIEGVTVGIALSRRQRDFDERDRRILTLLQPHLVRAYQNARLVARLEGEIALLRQGMDTLGGDLIMLTPGGRIHHATAAARAKLAEYFGRLPPGDRLPAGVEAWLRATTSKVPGIVPPSPLTERRGERCMRLTVLRGGGLSCLLLAERRDERPWAAASALGLTNREAEVLRWVAEGKTNPEIGLILGVSAATVHHHLDHVYRKLGVETRTAAAGYVTRGEFGG
jgi:DNA-binding CsgD family transcriptional regulator